MPDIDTMKISNYLKKEDVGTGVQVTIREVIEGNIAQEGKPLDLKWLIYFNEFDKPLVSNVTHREQIAAYLGSRNTDHWLGKQVVLFNDLSVLFGSNIGGIRVRPAQQTNTQTQFSGYEQSAGKTQLGYAQQPNQPNQQNQQQNQQQPRNSSFVPEFDDDIPGFD